MQIPLATELNLELPDQSEKVTDISAGSTFSHFLTDKGRVYAVGYGLGMGLNHTGDESNALYSYRPSQVKFPKEAKISKISAGIDFAVAASGGFFFLFFFFFLASTAHLDLH